MHVVQRERPQDEGADGEPDQQPCDPPASGEPDEDEHGGDDREDAESGADEREEVGGEQTNDGGGKREQRCQRTGLCATGLSVTMRS